MSNMSSAALTPEQWEARDYRQVARELDAWAKAEGTAPLAALALAEQPFGFTPADIQAVLQAADRANDEGAAAELRDLGRRIQALLPPASACVWPSWPEQEP